MNNKILDLKIGIHPSDFAYDTLFQLAHDRDRNRYACSAVNLVAFLQNPGAERLLSPAQTASFTNFHSPTLPLLKQAEAAPISLRLIFRSGDPAFEVLSRMPERRQRSRYLGNCIKTVVLIQALERSALAGPSLSLPAPKMTAVNMQLPAVENSEPLRATENRLSPSTEEKRETGSARVLAALRNSSRPLPTW